MTDITAILKLADELEIKAHMITMGEKIQWGGETDAMLRAGEVIRVLVAALENAKKHQEACVKTNTDALRGTTWHILKDGLERAAAIAKGENS